MPITEQFLTNAGAELIWELRAHRNILAKMRIASLLAEPRHMDPKSLVKHGFRVYSQTDEDGILQEIFRRIGVAHAAFVEFGCADGMENNSVYLLLQGWSGLWMDADRSNVAKVAKTFDPFLKAGMLRFKQSMVTRENVNELLAQEPKEIDLLSIDIDMNDYWVWSALECLYPRVVVIEYNASIHPPTALVVPYQPDRLWTGGNFFGASLSALEHLGSAKGYALVGCGITGVNAYFVRQDLLANHFAEPYTAERHYQPPNYSLFQVELDAHPRAIGVYQPVISSNAKNT